MPTVNQLAIELITELQEDSGDAGLVAVFEKHVNRALGEIALATDFNHFRLTSTFNTEIDQPLYKLPAGGRDIVQLRLTDTGEPIHYWTIQEAARRGVKIEEPGRPQLWIEDGIVTEGANNLYRFKLIPKPNIIVEVERTYLFNPSEVPSGTIFPIQDNLIIPVMDRVKAHWYEFKGHLDRSDRCQRRFEANLSKLIKKENNKIAEMLVLKPTDLANVRRWPSARLDPGHFHNP